MWRWSCNASFRRRTLLVFSTYVEMILLSKLVSVLRLSILHVCGDDPTTDTTTVDSYKYSPRMWRWSLHKNNNSQRWKVFSTYVEMIPPHHELSLNQLGILHVCGDDPVYVNKNALKTRYSPRMWRWSSYLSSRYLLLGVFSTYVEMILKKKPDDEKQFGILHVCGDDP